MFLALMARTFRHRLCTVGALLGLWWGLMMVLWGDFAFANDASTVADAASLTPEQAFLALLRLGGAPAAMGYVGWQIAKAIGTWTPKIVVELPESVRVVVVDDKGDRVLTTHEVMERMHSGSGD